MDIALTVALFFGIGFALDRWLGTTPLFMIGLTVLAAIGFFASFKYQYDARMEQLEAERAERAGGRRRAGGPPMTRAAPTCSRPASRARPPRSTSRPT